CYFCYCLFCYQTKICFIYLTMEPSEEHFYANKGIYFITDIVTPEYIESLEDFEIRGSDVFVVIHSKSGTVWTQNILSLIYHEGHRDGTENIETKHRAPWLEYNEYNMDYLHCPSPRLFVSHLPYYLVPRDLRSRRAKVSDTIFTPISPRSIGTEVPEGARGRGELIFHTLGCRRESLLRDPSVKERLRKQFLSVISKPLLIRI
uniref:Sulfotransferase n=1 Tax=Pelusios castaneus TaxID=367368 RepID=A0A8C8S5D1_9SAUR